MHSAYKTSQQFTQDIMLSRSGQMVDMRATYTILPANYFDKKLNTSPGEIISPGQAIELKKPTTKNSLASFGWQLPAFVLCLGLWWFMSSSDEPKKNY